MARHPSRAKFRRIMPTTQEATTPVPYSIPAVVLRPHPNNAHCTGDVALKFMRADFGRDGEMLARFREER